MVLKSVIGLTTRFIPSLTDLCLSFVFDSNLTAKELEEVIPFDLFEEIRLFRESWDWVIMTPFNNFRALQWLYPRRIGALITNKKFRVDFSLLAALNRSDLYPFYKNESEQLRSLLIARVNDGTVKAEHIKKLQKENEDIEDVDDRERNAIVLASFYFLLTFDLNVASNKNILRSGYFEIRVHGVDEKFSLYDLADISAATGKGEIFFTIVRKYNGYLGLIKSAIRYGHLELVKKFHSFIPLNGRQLRTMCIYNFTEEALLFLSEQKHFDESIVISSCVINGSTPLLCEVLKRMGKLKTYSCQPEIFARKLRREKMIKYLEPLTVSPYSRYNDPNNNDY